MGGAIININFISTLCFEHRIIFPAKFKGAMICFFFNDALSIYFIMGDRCNIESSLNCAL